MGVIVDGCYGQWVLWSMGVIVNRSYSQWEL